MSGKSTLSPLQLSHNNVQLKDIATLLKQRQAAMRLKPTDTNAATHLIRNALGGEDENYFMQLKYYLSQELPMVLIMVGFHKCSVFLKTW